MSVVLFYKSTIKASTIFIAIFPLNSWIFHSLNKLCKKVGVVGWLSWVEMTRRIYLPVIINIYWLSSSYLPIPSLFKYLLTCHAYSSFFLSHCCSMIIIMKMIVWWGRMKGSTMGKEPTQHKSWLTQLSCQGTFPFLLLTTKLHGEFNTTQVPILIPIPSLLKK